MNCPLVRPTTDRDGRIRNFTYDADNRQTNEAWIVGGNTVNTISYTFDAVGNNLSAANGNGAYTMTYDAINRVATEQEPFAQRLTMTYDAVGNRTQLQDSKNGVTTSIYDAANRLTTREIGGSGQTPLRVDFTYTARNQIATETRYSDLAGTQKVGSSQFTYDNAMRETNIQHLNGSNAILANYTYVYDTANRLSSETDNGGSPITYSYDATNQVTGDGTRTYSTDLNGNRTNTGFSTGTGNELSTDGTWNFTFDNEGNITKAVHISDGLTWTFSYDNLNHLSGAQQRQTDGGTLLIQTTYLYDAHAKLIERDVWTQVGGTTTTARYALDGDQVWADLDGTNTLQTRYLRGDAVDDLFARTSAAGAVGWYLADHLGSVRDIMGNTGSVLDHIDYDPFGNITNETNASSGDRYKYALLQWDTQLGLYWAGRRFYYAADGRWMSQDPLGFAARDSNLYRYVDNHPTNASDPSGLQIGYPNYIAPRPADNAIGGQGGSARPLSGGQKMIPWMPELTPQEKEKIKKGIQLLLDAANFDWDKPTGVFGNCKDWVLQYQRNTAALVARLNQEMGQYFQVTVMTWDNALLTPLGVDAGHQAIEIRWADGTVTYLDDGNLGFVGKHMFYPCNVPWYYKPTDGFPLPVYPKK